VSKSRRTHDQVLLPQIWDPVTTWRAISPQQQEAQIYPRVLGPLFVATYDSQSCVESTRPASARGSLIAQVQAQVIMRPTVSRPVCLGVGHQSGAHDRIFITVGWLWTSCRLTRRRVCNLLVQFAVTLRSKSLRTHDHILLSHLRLSQPGGPGPRIYIPQEQGPSYTPKHWVPFLSPLTTSRYTVELF
jgi:hypothetical protein